MHQIRGYSSNQWAFGQAKGRTESVLQQGENRVLQSSRDSDVFEEQLQVVLQARQTFLKADAGGRLARAALARSRKATNFETGNMVCYWRQGRGIPEGLWHGPARVVCVEKTGESQDGQLLGSIIWIVHGIVLYRCAPEQLRHVTHDLSGVDASLHENMTLSQILQRAETSMNYRDITSDAEALPADNIGHAEQRCPNLSREPEVVSRRLTSKQPALAQRMSLREALKKEVTKAEQAKAQQSFDKKVLANRCMDLDELGQIVLPDGPFKSFKGWTYAKVLEEQAEYILWLLDHQSQNVKYVPLLQFARRKQEAHTGKKMSIHDPASKSSKSTRDNGESDDEKSSVAVDPWLILHEKEERQNKSEAGVMEQMALLQHQVLELQEHAKNQQYLTVSGSGDVPGPDRGVNPG